MKYQIAIAAGVVAAVIAGAIMVSPNVNADSTSYSVTDFCPKSSVRYQEVKNNTATGDATTVKNIAECNISAQHVEDDAMETAQTIINVILSVVGIIAVIVMILGGISFITSQGDSAKVAKARNTILYGVVGLVIAILAFAIVNFVLSSFFSGGSETPSGEEESAAHYSIIS